MSAFHPNLEVVGLRRRLIPRIGPALMILMASLEDVHLAKPKSSCKRGAYAPSAVQKRAEIGTINAIALYERGLTSLAFNRRPHQISNVIGTPHITAHVSTARVSPAKARIDGSPIPLSQRR